MRRVRVLVTYRNRIIGRFWGRLLGLVWNSFTIFDIHLSPSSGCTKKSVTNNGCGGLSRQRAPDLPKNVSQPSLIL